MAKSKIKSNEVKESSDGTVVGLVSFFFSFCAILRAELLSDVEDDVAVCGTVKAFGGVQGSAGGGLGLLAGRQVTAFRVRGVTVVGRQLCDVI